MPIPTRSGPLKPTLPNEERQVNKVTYKPTSKITASSIRGTKISSNVSEIHSDAQVSKLKPPKPTSYAAADEPQSSKLTLPKPKSFPGSATQHVELHRAAQVRNDVPNISEQSTLTSSSLPETVQSSSIAVERATAGRGHSRQQSVMITKPRLIPSGHKRTTSTITSQSAKAGSAESLGIRPDFNNFQQHFSPKKAKPSADTRPSLKPRNAENSGTHLQRSFLEDELLQLQLVHRESDKSLRRFRESAENHLENMQQTLLLKQTEVFELESQHQRQLSLQALDDWLKMPSEFSKDQKIQRLSKAIDELARLEQLLWEPDGLLTAFEEWHNVALAVISHRELDKIPDRFEVISSLGLQWNNSMFQAKEKAVAALGVLESLKPGGVESGIYTLVVSYIGLGENLIGEMEMAMNIEKKISDQEHEWIQLEIDTAIQDYAREKGSNQPPVWNSV